MYAFYIDKKAFFLISPGETSTGPRIYELVTYTVDEKKKLVNIIFIDEYNILCGRKNVVL